jgi:hypothetical protein
MLKHETTKMTHNNQWNYRNSGAETGGKRLVRWGGALDGISCFLLARNPEIIK